MLHYDSVYLCTAVYIRDNEWPATFISPDEWHLQRTSEPAN